MIEDVLENVLMDLMDFADVGGNSTSREVVDNILRHLELESVHW